MPAISRRSSLRLALALCVALVAWSVPSMAAQRPPGSFDKSFSGDGRVLTSFPGISHGQDTYVMENGRVLQVGYRQNDTTVLLRFRPNGTPDNSFGGDGSITVPIPEDSERRRVIARGSTIFVAATTYQGVDNDGNWVFVKVNNDGTVDDDYGDGGLFVVDEGGDDRIRDLAPGMNGKFYGVGQSHDGQGRVMVARFGSDGTLDDDADSDPGVSWAEDGVFTTYIEGGPSPLGAHEMGSGKVLVGGAGNNYSIIMIRFDADGVVDESFQTGGSVEHEFGDNLFHIERIGFGEGRMYVAADGDDSESGFLRVGAFTFDGDFDTSFGTNGRKNVRFDGSVYASHIAVDSHGRPVIALNHYLPSAQNAKWALLRLKTDGARDDAFGNNGVTSSPDWPATGEDNMAVRIQTDGRIVAGGSVVSNGDAKIGVARYLSGACGIRGTSNGEILVGTPAKDYICGLGEDDELIGLGSDDRIVGGDGDDIINGGPGRDICVGGPGADTLTSCEVQR